MDNRGATSAVVGDKRLWDITKQFREAATILPIGTLVKDDSFTLFESVSALEIMDPKMDSGCLAPGEALVAEYNVEQPLLPEEIIGIIDQMLCCEMAWHQGYPLSQTLFSSHYIDKLLYLEAKSINQAHFSIAGKDDAWLAPMLHLVLRSICIGVIKCCDFALEEINRSLDGGGTRSNFFEEEDFSGYAYGRDLFTQIPLNHALDLLAAADEFVESERQASLKGQRPTAPAILAALSTRLYFRNILLRAMAPDEDIENRRRLWQEATTILAEISRTHSIAKLVPSAFSATIQRRLASTVPPKPMVELTFEDAMTRLSQLAGDSQAALKIVEFGPENIQTLKAFLWAFSSRRPEPLAYSRACIAAPLFACDDVGFKELLRRDIEDLVLPGDSIMDPVNWTVEIPPGQTSIQDRRVEIASLIDRFTEIVVRMPGGYVDYFRTLTSNRCRLRRNLVHVAAAFEHIHLREVERMDAALEKLAESSVRQPLTTWTYFQKLRIMEWIIQLGFELDLYLPYELAEMYWYLAQLVSVRISIIDNIVSQLEAPAQEHQTARAPSDRNRSDQALDYLRSLRAEASGTASLATALSSVYVYLANTEASSIFHRPKTHDAHLRYEVRMKPFNGIQRPKLPTYEELQVGLHSTKPSLSNGNSSVHDSSEALIGMESNLKDARTRFAEFKKLGPGAAGCVGLESEFDKTVAALLQSCIAAGLAVVALKRSLSPSSVTLPLPYDGRYHEWWIVPSIKL